MARGPSGASSDATIFARHGFWSIPPGGRNLIHADGTPRLLCADTPWALPWRATVEQAEVYARYCRYLVARYGARPAIWLVGGDGTAMAPSILERRDYCRMLQPASLA